MIRPIITYPNPMLFEDSKPVEVFDTNLHTLLDDMYETMMDAQGVGLAAVQVAQPINALIINLPDDNGIQHKADLIEVINPKIIERSGEQFNEEGCLSVPDFQAVVRRFQEITVEFQDRFANPQVLKPSGYLAVAFQHEMDHLTGSLFVQRLSMIDNKKFQKHLKHKKVS